MRLLALLVFSIFFFGMSCGVAKKSTAMVRYTDQNNNTYTISENSFRYLPITEKESSSGNYSGGASVTKTITSETFSKVLQMAQTILSEAPSDIKREMMTSVVSISENGNTQSAILRKSNKRTKFEATLEKIKRSLE